jgi:hypothetical protein
MKRLSSPLLVLATLLAGSSAMSAPPIEKGLVARWRFDEGAGAIARDSTGNGADCGTRGAKWAKGPAGGAVELNGKTDYLEARDPRKANITGAFTISFWINPAAWQDQYSTGVLSKKRSDATPGYVIYADGNMPTKITLRIAGTAGGHAMLTSASDVDEDIWQHWAVTYDPNTQTLDWYKNGRLDKRYQSITIGDTSNDTPLQIGHAHTWNGYYDGLLGQIEIFDRALSPDEISREYGTGGPTVRSASVPVKWRVVSTRFPTDDVVVAGCTVKEAGAKGDGKTDDTTAFQSAMGSMARAGGGTVFVPEGRYVIRGNLRVPTGVTLRGEWEQPRSNAPLRGTILMAYAGRGDMEGRPFIGLRQCSGMKDLAIWYPEQDAQSIVPYPFCIEQMGSASGTVANVTLVNPYLGIRTDYGSYLHYIHNMYGSPLSIGIEIDFVSDTGRVDNIQFGPDFWSSSGLPGAPTANGPHTAWMRANGTGMLFRRYEWIYSAFVKLSGYNTGVRMVNSKAFGETNGQMYQFAIANCGTAVDITDANFAGISFTKCTLDGSEYGVVTRPTFNSRLLFHSCAIGGRVRAALLDGIADQSILFQQCSFAGEVERVRGDLVMLGCSVDSPGDHIRLGDQVNAATIAGTTFSGPARIVNDCRSGKVSITSDPVPAVSIPSVPPPTDKRLAPARPVLFVVTDRPRAAKQALPGDDTSIIQSALDRAAKAGGGVVLLPPGVYALRGHLTIPPGVELRGVYDVEHHTRGWGSVVQVYAGRNDENGAPAIVMERNSGLRGLTFYYPEQRYDTVVPYPFLVQGRGAGIYVVNVTAANPYKLLDFKTYRCDGHHIEYAAGAPLRVGIAVGGGSVGGEVINTQFNSHYWAWCPFPDCPGLGPSDMGAGRNPVWAYQYRNLEAFVFGDCRDELQYQNTVFGSHTGLHFVAENGAGASGVVLGHGTDGSMVSMQFDGLSPQGIDVINSQLVTMNCANVPPTSEKTYVRCGPGLRSTARMINTTFWGTPANAVVVQGGGLDIDLASFCMYGPLLVDGGRLQLDAAFLGQPTAGDRELTVRTGGRIDLMCNLSPAGMRANPDAPAGAISERLANRRR